MGIYSFYNSLFYSNPDVQNIEYPICKNCSSIILINKIDIINNTIDYQCEECFKEMKNEYMYNFLNREIYEDFSKYLRKDCKIHNKEYSYFCETCFRHNCDDCLEKQRYPKHKFIDSKENKITDSKIKELNEQIQEETNFFNNLLNKNDLLSFYDEKNQFQKYKNIYPSNELFSDNNFLRILKVNIKEKLDIINLKKILIKYNLEYPNNYLTI